MSKILIIEDDIDMQETILAFFRQKGFEVLVYSEAEKALSDLSKRAVQADVIVTDLMLPNMTGMQLIKTMKEQGINIPIILATSNKSVETAIEAIQSGAYDFVVKPIHFSQLLISVERAIHFSKLRNENETLKTAIQTKEGTSIDNIVGKSKGFSQALDLARRVSSSTANVLITGESGTGKEVIARATHHLGSRAGKPFVAINCSAIPENLLESELFGHAKGAFTGAANKKPGLFEEAEGGTLFLDEIGDMNVQLQAKLLRVIQERKIKRVGENSMRDIDVRIISATCRDLRKEVAEGRFREDLFFRLNVIPIRIPPLRERREDILPLAEFFLKKFAALNHSPAKSFSKEALERLFSHPWYGNVRELENTIERAVVLSNRPEIQGSDLQDFEEGRHMSLNSPSGVASPESNAPTTFSSTENSFESMSSLGGGGNGSPPSHLDACGSLDLRAIAENETMPIDRVMKLYIRQVLEKNKGAKEKTAKELRIDRKTLYRKLREMETEKLL